jgi:hypothetical protein
MNIFLLFLLPICFAFNCDTTLLERQTMYEKALNTLQNFKGIQSNLTFTKRSLGNPGGTYGAFLFPEYLQPLSLKYLEKNISSFFNSSQVSTVMGNKDALIFLTCTPPSSDYFSIVNYVLARFNSTKTHWLAGVPLNDPINNLIINTTKNEYNSTTLIISTGDINSYNNIKKAFIDAGLNKNAINFLPIPNDKVKFRHYIEPWILDQSDLISWHFRISSYNKTDTYIQEYLNTNWEFYFLKHYNGIFRNSELEPAYSAPLRKRETNNNQLYLESKYNELINKITNKMNTYNLTHQIKLNHVIPDFEQCLTNNSYYGIFYPIPEWNFTGLSGFCDFFVRDSLYSMYPNVNSTSEILKDLKFYKNRTFIAVGINQVKMRQCVYSNLLISTLSHPEDPLHTSNLTALELNDSTNQYGKNFDEFYTYKWSRNCEKNELYCQEFNENQINSTTDWIIFAERKYLNPKTKIGPSEYELLPPTILIFDKI